MLRCATATIMAVACLAASAAKGQDAQDSIASFYRGKTVSIVVGSAVGGGFAGSREIMIAIERNEVQGMCGMDWSSFLTQQPAWVSSGFARLLAQEDLKGHPVMNKMGVPLTISFAKNAEVRDAMELIYSQNLFGRPYIMSPGVPADRVAALRQAF